jgi:hypothetical protein
MLEMITGPHGHQVIKREGRYLASLYAPEKEANVFVNAFQEWCAHKPTVVVFGAGSGYHLRELQRRFPTSQKFLFENDPQLLQLIEKIHGPTEFEVVESISPAVMQGLNAGAVLVRHLPSWVGRESWFEPLWAACKGPSIVEVAQEIENGSKPVKQDDRAWLILRELFR